MPGKSNISDEPRLFFERRAEWRAWLKKHFQSQLGVWLIFPHLSSGKTRISYNDAVEEALCFGWIDSTVRSLDQLHSMQRFTPRNPRSRYSQLNKERLKLLAKLKLIHADVLKQVLPLINETYTFPADILAEIRKEKVAWLHYQSFSEAYKRIRIAYIDDARARPEEFDKRLAHFIRKTKLNQAIKGSGGTDQYY